MERRGSKAAAFRRRRLPTLAAALLLATTVHPVTLTSTCGFVPGARVQALPQRQVGPQVARQWRSGRSSASQYPNLSRLEDAILESCAVKDGEAGEECMQVYNKLIETHFKAQQECDVDSQRCAVLNVLDRLARGITGKDGLVLLDQLREAVEALERMYSSWQHAFHALNEDKDEGLSREEFGRGLSSLGLKLSERTLDSLFLAADVDGDQKIGEQEFSDFLVAGVVAAEPLQALRQQKKRVGGRTEDLLRWAVRSNLDYHPLYVDPESMPA